ncbi:MAG: 5'(3')-deoxyribonucleotidase [Alicyclobacillaceae bacterium]|nr:5'(3')-deoxyribonucleotidase [Alicyclobacillaceae bacterium]
MKTLLIDMDSVIVDLMSAWCKRYNDDWNDNLTPADILTWEWEKYVKPECGRKIYQYLDEPDMFLNLEPLPHAIEVLERLSRHFEILIVTSSRRGAMAQKDEWVSRHLPFIGRRNLIFAHRKDKVCGDLLFDDAPHNLEAFRRTGRLAVAMDYAYNRHVDCLRVSGWLDFEQLVWRLFGGEADGGGWEDAGPSKGSVGCCRGGARGHQRGDLGPAYGP